MMERGALTHRDAQGIHFARFHTGRNIGDAAKGCVTLLRYHARLDNGCFVAVRHQLQPRE